MSAQIYDTGDVIQAGVNTVEVTGVSYRENEDGEKFGFTYTIRLKSELDQERAEEAQRQKAADEAAKQAEKLTPDQVSEPDEEGTK